MLLLFYYKLSFIYKLSAKTFHFLQIKKKNYQISTDLVGCFAI